MVEALTLWERAASLSPGERLARLDPDVLSALFTLTRWLDLWDEQRFEVGVEGCDAPVLLTLGVFAAGQDFGAVSF